MLELAASVPATDWVRLSLVYAHLLACVAALALVARADWRLLAGTSTLDGLRRTARATTFALLTLWLTGLALVHRDTGLDPAALAASPKLALKLLTVTVLTLNGALLHALSFPILAGDERPSLPQSAALAFTGAVSTSHWLLAAFVGVSRPLGDWPLETLLAGYALYGAAVLCVAMLCVPFLRRRLDACRRRVPSSSSPATRIGEADGRSEGGRPGSASEDIRFADASERRSSMPPAAASSPLARSPDDRAGARSGSATGPTDPARATPVALGFGLVLTVTFLLVALTGGPADRAGGSETSGHVLGTIFATGG